MQKQHARAHIQLTTWQMQAYIYSYICTLVSIPFMALVMGDPESQGVWQSTTGYLWYSNHFNSFEVSPNELTSTQLLQLATNNNWSLWMTVKIRWQRTRKRVLWNQHRHLRSDLREKHDPWSVETTDPMRQTLSRSDHWQTKLPSMNSPRLIILLFCISQRSQYHSLASHVWHQALCLFMSAWPIGSTPGHNLSAFGSRAAWMTMRIVKPSDIACAMWMCSSRMKIGRHLIGRVGGKAVRAQWVNTARSVYQSIHVCIYKCMRCQF